MSRATGKTHRLTQAPLLSNLGLAQKGLMRSSGYCQVMFARGVLFLRECANVSQDTRVNAMNDRVRPPSPVLRGPQAVLIPGGSLEQSPAVRQRHKPKLAP